MDEGNEIGLRIAKLRDHGRVTQTYLAEVLGVTPAAVSQYESGDAKPSIATLFKLAHYAMQWDDDEGALFFWHAAGLRDEYLSSVVEMFIKTSGTDSGAINKMLMSAARTRANDLGLAAGTVVPVPRYALDGAPDKDARSPLYLPADLGEAASGLRYFEAPPLEHPFGHVDRGFAPGDRIVYDATGAAKASLLSFEFEAVLAYFAPGNMQKGWPPYGGLFVGRLGAVNVGTGFAVVLAPLGSHPIHYHGDRKRIMHSAPQGVPHGCWPIIYGTVSDVKRTSEIERAFLSGRLPSGFGIRGRVVAILPAGAKR
jgi:transcriptional regulator with XRE-family HTH domain